jgi:hypothetical protein
LATVDKNLATTSAQSALVKFVLFNLFWINSRKKLHYFGSTLYGSMDNGIRITRLLILII